MADDGLAWTRRRPGDTVLGENWIDMPPDIRGASLNFSFAREPLEGRRAARIADYTDGDVAEEDRHDEFIAWFVDSGRRLRRALGPQGEISSAPGR